MHPGASASSLDLRRWAVALAAVILPGHVSASCPSGETCAGVNHVFAAVAASVVILLLVFIGYLCQGCSRNEVAHSTELAYNMHLSRISGNKGKARKKKSAKQLVVVADHKKRNFKLTTRSVVIPTQQGLRQRLLEVARRHPAVVKEVLAECVNLLSIAPPAPPYSQPQCPSFECPEGAASAQDLRQSEANMGAWWFPKLLRCLDSHCRVTNHSGCRESESCKSGVMIGRTGHGARDSDDLGHMLHRDNQLHDNRFTQHDNYGNDQYDDTNNSNRFVQVGVSGVGSVSNAGMVSSSGHPSTDQSGGHRRVFTFGMVHPRDQAQSMEYIAEQPPGGPGGAGGAVGGAAADVEMLPRSQGHDAFANVAVEPRNGGGPKTQQNDLVQVISVAPNPNTPSWMVPSAPQTVYTDDDLVPYDPDQPDERSFVQRISTRHGFPGVQPGAY